MIELTNVSKHYPGGVAALNDVSMTIEPGEMVGVVGPSGSGKSTLLHLIGALDRPTEGTVRLAGLDIGKLRDDELSALRAYRIGFVFQQFHLLAGLSARDSVADGLLYTGTSMQQRRVLAEETLRSVGLGDRLSHRPNEMSGGERQRVAISRAVVGKPDILLADEPTGNLDSVAGASIMRLLHELHARGTTVVVITHDHQIAAQMQRCVELLDGKVRNR